MNQASQTGMKETFPLNAICGDLRSFSASICGKPLDFQKKSPCGQQGLYKPNSKTADLLSGILECLDIVIIVELVPVFLEFLFQSRHQREIGVYIGPHIG